MIHISTIAPSHTRPKKAQTRKPTTRAHTSFASAMGHTQKAQSAPATDTASALASLSMLTLHEADYADAARQQQLACAHHLLNTLEALRDGLLQGGIPVHILRDLENNMGGLKHHATNPDLRDVMEEVELRAAVELAKLHAARQ